MHSLALVAKQINGELAAQSSMAIGKRLMHPDGYMVEVISGYYLDPKYGRVSNHWSWKRVNEDGTLSENAESGCGW